MSEPIFSIEDLTLSISGRRGTADIVRHVDLHVAAGETLAIVGESGSGKTMTMLAATGLAPPSAHVTGRVRLRGEELSAASREAARRLRGRHIGFVFQDPMTSLNPVMPVGRQVSEACEVHLGMSRHEGRRRAIELLEMVGVPDPSRRVDGYPHQFSGGMRQRVMIAMGLACEPALLVADEPTTALDVTTQAQIVELVADLQSQIGMAVVWITHDLGVVAGIADRVMVMYGGCVVEEADVDRLFAQPKHPYTQGLLAARPTLGQHGGELVTIPGSPPTPYELPAGCPFWDRCPKRLDPRCETELPPLADVGAGHLARTFCLEPGDTR